MCTMGNGHTIAVSKKKECGSMERGGRVKTPPSPLLSLSDPTLDAPLFRSVKGTGVGGRGGRRCTQTLIVRGP